MRRTLIAFDPPLRPKSAAMTSASPQTSLSKAPPFEEKTPTTVQSCFWSLTEEPMSRPWMRCAILSPTMTSYRPGLKARPWTIWIPLRTSKARGVTPRTEMLVGSPSFFGFMVTTTSSGEARGWPSAPRAISSRTTI